MLNAWRQVALSPSEKARYDDLDHKQGIQIERMILTTFLAMVVASIVVEVGKQFLVLELIN